MVLLPIRKLYLGATGAPRKLTAVRENKGLEVTYPNGVGYLRRSVPSGHDVLLDNLLKLPPNPQLQPKNLRNVATFNIVYSCLFPLLILIII